MLSYGSICRSVPAANLFSGVLFDTNIGDFLRLAWVQIILTEGFHYSLSFFRNLP